MEASVYHTVCNSSIVWVGFFYQIIVFKIKEKDFKNCLISVELWLHVAYSESGQRFVNYF